MDFGPDIQVEQGALLADYATFQLGGLCRLLLTCRTEAELKVAVEQLHAGHESFYLLGGGSNLLISDQGLDQVVLRYVHPALSKIKREGHSVYAEASGSLDALAEATAEAGLRGLICCSGIPGTIGGAIVGNAGAWGQQIADVLTSVRLMNRQGEVRDVDPDTLGFAYRRSALQDAEEIVVGASFELEEDRPEALSAERSEILKVRAEKHPDLKKDLCIGSIFRNIEPTSAAGRRQAAGGFLEDAGVKQFCVGGARVFEKHANIVVKGEGCTAQEVYELIERMHQAVLERFELDLVREVRFWGPFEEKQAPLPTRH